MMTLFIDNAICAMYNEACKLRIMAWILCLWKSCLNMRKNTWCYSRPDPGTVWKSSEWTKGLRWLNSGMVSETLTSGGETMFRAMTQLGFLEHVLVCSSTGLIIGSELAAVSYSSPECLKCRQQRFFSVTRHCSCGYVFLKIVHTWGRFAAGRFKTERPVWVSGNAKQANREESCRSKDSYLFRSVACDCTV